MGCFNFFLLASRWEEAGGPVQAAWLGCAHHPALVSTTAQPGEAEHPRQILWKHVRHIAPKLATCQLYCIEQHPSLTKNKWQIPNLPKKSYHSGLCICLMSIAASVLRLGSLTKLMYKWGLIWIGCAALPCINKKGSDSSKSRDDW